MFTRGESHEKSPVSVKDTQVQLFYACGRFGLYKEMTGPPWSRWVSVIFQYYFFWWCVVPETISKLFETSRVADSSSCVSSLTLGLLYFLLMLLDIRTPYIVWLVVSTPLKNISRLGLLFPIYGKLKSVPNHQPAWCPKGIMFYNRSFPKGETHTSPTKCSHIITTIMIIIINDICTSKQIANSFFWYVFFQQKGAHKKGRVGCLRIA